MLHLEKRNLLVALAVFCLMGDMKVNGMKSSPLQRQRWAGLVVQRADGTRKVYELNDRGNLAHQPPRAKRRTHPYLKPGETVEFSSALRRVAKFTGNPDEPPSRDLVESAQADTSLNGANDDWDIYEMGPEDSWDTDPNADVL
jgi:hypothetical protein